MNFIDASDAHQNVSCPSCGGRMLYVQKGKFAEKYICESCGMTIDPALEYTSHQSRITNRSEDESDPDSFIIVQKEDHPKNQEDCASRELRQDIERGGRRQVVSITDLNSTSFASKESNLSKVNRIERPKRN